MALNIYTPDGNKIVHTTGVDFNNRSKFFRPVHVVQYDDKLPILAVSLYNNGEEYALPASADANIRVGKPGRKFVERAALGCSEDRKTVYFDITVQMVTDWGKLYPIITIVIGDAVAGSSPILLVVERNPIQNGDIESSDEYIDLDKSVQAAKDYAEQAKEASQGMDAYATRAEEAADRAEGAVESLTNEVERAETAAQKAEEAASGVSQAIEDATAGIQDDFDKMKEEALGEFNQVKDDTMSELESMQKTITEAVQTTTKNAETAQQYSGNPPQVGETGNWEIWDAESSEYQDSGKRAILNFDVTYPSEDEMNADAEHQPTNTLAIISTDVDKEENAKVYIKNQDGTWHFLSDLSGFTGVGIQTWEKIDGTGAPGTKDTYKVTWTDGRFFTYEVYNGHDGEGAGDMTASVYDKNGKKTDIFEYVDEKAAGIVTTISEETPTTLTGVLTGDGEHVAALTGTSGQVVGFDETGTPTVQDAAEGTQGPPGPAGENGATFTPTVSRSGLISWSNDKNLPNPETVSIQGPQGRPGAAGTAAGFGQPTATVGTGTGEPIVSVTTDGPDTAKIFNFEFDNLKGAPGDPGPAGPNEITEATTTTLNGLLSGNGSTVEALTGTTDQVVGFDEDGKPIAKEISIPTGEYLEKGVKSEAEIEQATAKWSYQSTDIGDETKLAIEREGKEVAVLDVSTPGGEGSDHPSGSLLLNNNGQDASMNYGVGVIQYTNNRNENKYMNQWWNVHTKTISYITDDNSDVTLSDIAIPTKDTDAANKKYVDEKVGDIKTSVTEETETTITGLLKGNGATIEQAVADEDYVTKQYVDEKAGSIEFATDEDVDTAKEYLTDAQPIWFTIELRRDTYANGQVEIKNVSGRTIENVTCKWITNADVTNPNQWVDQANELPSLSKTYTDQYQLSETLIFSENTSITIYVLVNSVLVSTYSSEGYPSENDDAFFSYVKVDTPELEDKSTLVKQVVELVDEALYEIVSKRYLRNDIDGCPITLRHDGNTEYVFAIGNDGSENGLITYYPGVRFEAHLNPEYPESNAGTIDIAGHSQYMRIKYSGIETRTPNGNINISFNCGSYNRAPIITFNTSFEEKHSPYLRYINNPVDDHDAATKQYVDNLVKPTINTYTLSQSTWMLGPGSDAYVQTIIVNGVSEDETSQIVQIVPKVSDYKKYLAAGICAVGVSNGSITFECTEQPETDITLYITIQDAISGVVA